MAAEEKADSEELQNDGQQVPQGSQSDQSEEAFTIGGLEFAADDIEVIQAGSGKFGKRKVQRSTPQEQETDSAEATEDDATEPSAQSEPAEEVAEEQPAEKVAEEQPAEEVSEEQQEDKELSATLENDPDAEKKADYEKQLEAQMAEEFGPLDEEEEDKAEGEEESSLSEAIENDPDADTESGMEQQSEAQMATELDELGDEEVETDESATSAEQEPAEAPAEQQEQAPSPTPAPAPTPAPTADYGGSRGGVIPAPSVKPEPDVSGSSGGGRTLQVLVGSNLVLIAAVVVLMIWLSPSAQDSSAKSPDMQQAAIGLRGDSTDSSTRNGQEQPSARAEDSQLVYSDSEGVPEDSPVVDNEPAPTSWAECERALAEQQYARALLGYSQLLEQSRIQPDNQLITDLLRLRMAQSYVHLGQHYKADELYSKVLISDSPLIRAVARYQLAVRDALGKQFLRARMRTYKAIADLALLESPLPLEMDCDFLIARVLSEKVFGYYGKGDSFDWQSIRINDPFIGADAAEILRLIRTGQGRHEGAVLGPQVSRDLSQSGQRRFSVACTRTGIEKLLAAFVAKAELQLEWAGVSAPARSRAVSLRYSNITEQRLSEVSCGLTGLIGSYDGQRITVHDPQTYVMLSEQRDLLHHEAKAVWRRLFLRASDDPRLPEGRLAYAVLSECAGEVDAAMREYQLIAQRFPRNPSAPVALLQSADMRIRLRDYTGARADLLNMLDQYPDSHTSDQVYMKLAEATMNAGLFEEAIRAYRGMYYKELSSESQRKACIGASKCFASLGKMDEAKKWAIRYLGLADTQEEGLAEAYMLIGQAEALAGNDAEAAAAYYRALAYSPPRDLYVQAALDLAEVEMRRKQYILAMNAMHRLGKLSLTPGQTAKFAISMSQIYRDMGIPEKGAILIRNHMLALSDMVLQAKLSQELARCYLAENDIPAAERTLVEFLPKMEAGPSAHESVCLLAEIYLKTKRPKEAITLTRPLTYVECSDEIRQRVSDILGQAYIQQEEYGLAADVLTAAIFMKEGQDK